MIAAAVGIEGVFVTVYSRDGRRQLREGEITNELARRHREYATELARKDQEIAALRQRLDQLTRGE